MALAAGAKDKHSILLGERQLAIFQAPDEWINHGVETPLEERDIPALARERLQFLRPSIYPSLSDAEFEKLFKAALKDGPSRDTLRDQLLGLDPLPLSALPLIEAAILKANSTPHWLFSLLGNVHNREAARLLLGRRYFECYEPTYERIKCPLVNVGTPAVGVLIDALATTRSLDEQINLVFLLAKLPGARAARAAQKAADAVLPQMVSELKDVRDANMDVLGGYLSGPDPKVDRFRKLGHLGIAAAATLKEMLGDGRVEVRARAAHALGHIGALDVKDTLLRMQKRHPEKSREGRAARQALEELARHEDWTRTSTAGLAAIAANLNDDRGPGALRILAARGKESLPFLVDLVRQLQGLKTTRYERGGERLNLAVGSIVHIGREAESALPMLFDLLDDVRVRDGLAYPSGENFLGAMGISPTVLARELARRKDQGEEITKEHRAFPRPQQRVPAEPGLADSVPALLPLLEHKDPEVAMGAADVLATIGPDAKAALPRLASWVEAGGPRAMPAAENMLRITRTSNELGPVPGFLLKQIAEGQHVERTVAAGLMGSIEGLPGAFLPRIEAILRQRDARMLHEFLLGAAVKSGSEQGIALASQYLQAAQNEFDREAAVRALRFAPASSTATLRAAADSAKGAASRLAFARVLVHLRSREGVQSAKAIAAGLLPAVEADLAPERWNLVHQRQAIHHMAYMLPILPAAEAALIDAADHPDPYVRLYAIQALARSAAPATAHILRKGIKDHPAIAATAQWALLQHSRQFASVLERWRNCISGSNASYALCHGAALSQRAK
jgi:HEAT repeat protein